MKVTNPFEIILTGKTTLVVNKGRVFNMAEPLDGIEVDKAIENGWKETGDPFVFSETNNKIYVKVDKETTPTGPEPSHFLSSEEVQSSINGTLETTTISTYFKLGELYSAEAILASSWAESSEENIIVKIAEIDFETKSVTQYCMSDIFLLNPLLWTFTEVQSSDSDESDSDSDQSDSDSDDSDSDSGTNDSDSDFASDS